MSLKNNYLSHKAQSRRLYNPTRKILCNFCENDRETAFVPALIEKFLTKRYRASQNFYYIREINDICFQRVSMYNIRFVENNICDDEKENLRRFYEKNEIRNKMLQIFKFFKEKQLESKPKIYLQEFYEIMMVNSLKKIQSIHAKKTKSKPFTFMKIPTLPIQIQPLKNFNILEGIDYYKPNIKENFNTIEGFDDNKANIKGKLTKIIVKEQNSNDSQEFSRFLREKRINIEISLIKKTEEINDVSFNKISPEFLEQIKQAQIPEKNTKSNKIPISRQISIKITKNHLKKNALLIKNKQSLLNSDTFLKKPSLGFKLKLQEPLKNKFHQEFSPFPLQITTFSEKKIAMTERENDKKSLTIKNKIKSNSNSPNTVYNRFFMPGKYNGNLGKTESNLQKHKNMNSEYFDEKKQREILHKNNKNSKEYPDDYLMISERKMTEEKGNYEQRFGKS